MMAARGLQPRGIDVVLLELAHELVTTGRAVPFVFNPIDSSLYRAPSEWFALPALYDHHLWADTRGAPHRRHFNRRSWLALHRVKLAPLPPDPGACYISFGRPELTARLLRDHPQLYTVSMIHDLSMALGKHVDNQSLINTQSSAAMALIHGSNRLFCPSQPTAADVLQMAPDATLQVLPLAYWFREIAATSCPVELPFFLHIGPLKYWKNGPVLMEGYSKARALVPDLPPLVVAGRVRQKSDKSIIYVKNPTHAQVQSLYSNCSGLIVPSMAEGFCLPFGEALHFHRPIVHSNALRSLVPPAKGGIGEFDGRDSDDVARAILDLRTAPPTRLTVRRTWGDVADELCAGIT